MTQAQPLGARDLPDHQYGKALAAKWMKGMGYLGRSQSLAGLECSSKQPCRRSPIAWRRQSQRWCWSRRWNQSSTPTGYRPGRSALDAVGVARKRGWAFDWVIDLDIKSFLDVASYYTF